VTRSEVGILSDQMHKYGDYKGLTYVSTDPAKNEYTYRANFTKGSMNVVVKLDADGKVAAYRVFAPVAAIQSP
jgi:6-phosphogluconolactonase (cycloisomerase 2 family)